MTSVSKVLPALARRRAVHAEAAPAGPAFPPVDIAIVCESTYPYLKGGLSAVVQQLCEAHPGFTIGIVHITWDRAAPHDPMYDVPEQVRWVMPVYQSVEEHAAFKAFRVRDTGLGTAARAEAADRVVAAVDAHFAGTDELLWRLYDDGVNPLTRTFRLWPVLASKEFMRVATARWGDCGLSLTDLFWQLREFFSLAYAVTDVRFPVAGVYHAHTTGAASLLAAAAARQNGTRFLLTEHNLYARDTINVLLNRGLDTRVGLDEWRTIDEYPTADFPSRTGKVLPAKRAWLAWFARLGIVAYRAADLVTYLFPDAIGEAAALGGFPDKSHVLPNGVDAAQFDDARARTSARLEAPAGTERRWRFACAGRVVPIKGQLDLLEALAALQRQGVTGWSVDVMGPEGESPEYVALCKERCAELGLADRVRFLGPVNLREVLGDYDALLLPSHNEGQPIVVLEAMTAGLPTVGTYVGGMKQLVEDELQVSVEGEHRVLGPCGLLVQPHDPEGLARAIGALMADRELFLRLRADGLERVEHYFGLESAMSLYTAVYRMLGGTDEVRQPRSLEDLRRAPEAAAQQASYT